MRIEERPRGASLWLIDPMLLANVGNYNCFVKTTNWRTYFVDIKGKDNSLTGYQCQHLLVVFSLEELHYSRKHCKVNLSSKLFIFKVDFCIFFFTFVHKILNWRWSTRRRWYWRSKPRSCKSVWSFLFFPIIWNLNQYNDDNRSSINKYKLILDLKKRKTKVNERIDVLDLRYNDVEAAILWLFSGFIWRRNDHKNCLWSADTHSLYSSYCSCHTIVHQ